MFIVGPKKRYSPQIGTVVQLNETRQKTLAEFAKQDDTWLAKCG